MPEIMQVALARRAKLKQELARIESFIRMANALLDASPGAARPAAADTVGPEPTGSGGLSVFLGPGPKRAARFRGRTGPATREVAPGVVRLVPGRPGSVGEADLG